MYSRGDKLPNDTHSLIHRAMMEKISSWVIYMGSSISVSGFIHYNPFGFSDRCEVQLLFRELEKFGLGVCIDGYSDILVDPVDDLIIPAWEDNLAKPPKERIDYYEQCSYKSYETHWPVDSVGEPRNVTKWNFENVAKVRAK